MQGIGEDAVADRNVLAFAGEQPAGYLADIQALDDDIGDILQGYCPARDCDAVVPAGVLLAHVAQDDLLTFLGLERDGFIPLAGVPGPEDVVLLYACR